MNGFLALGGGWWSADEEPLLRVFTQGLGRLLYWPFAVPPARHPELVDYLAERLAPFGVTEIETWRSLAGHRPDELPAFSGIWLGGGDTFRLRHHLRQHGFVNSIAQFVALGGRVYAGSAGAVLLGRTIDTAEDARHHKVRIDSTGLGLVGEFAVWVHYEPAQADAVRAWSLQRKIPVLALPDRSGAIVADETIICVGHEPYDCFFGTQHHQVKPNQHLQLPQRARIRLP